MSYLISPRQWFMCGLTSVSYVIFICVSTAIFSVTKVGNSPQDGAGEFLFSGMTNNACLFLLLLLMSSAFIGLSIRRQHRAVALGLLVGIPVVLLSMGVFGPEIIRWATGIIPAW